MTIAPTLKNDPAVRERTNDPPEKGRLHGRDQRLPDASTPVSFVFTFDDITWDDARWVFPRHAKNSLLLYTRQTHCDIRFNPVWPLPPDRSATKLWRNCTVKPCTTIACICTRASLSYGDRQQHSSARTNPNLASRTADPPTRP